MEECVRSNVKGVLDLKNEDAHVRCLQPKISPKIATIEMQPSQVSKENKTEVQKQSEATPA
ncbi:MAG: hypothetical protein ABSA75_00500 [Candidatus Bathyarchaeia archaeon]|jgi:hypothetical protein